MLFRMSEVLDSTPLISTDEQINDENDEQSMILSVHQQFFSNLSHILCTAILKDVTEYKDALATLEGDKTIIDEVQEIALLDQQTAASSASSAIRENLDDMNTVQCTSLPLILPHNNNNQMLTQVCTIGA